VANSLVLDRQTGLKLMRELLYIRMVEETMAQRYGEQEMRCPVHLSVGQEAVAVGVCQELNDADRLFSTHRCHAHYLAKGGNLRAMLAEIYGKAAGCLGGRGGSMHLADPECGMIASVPIVASSIPLAVGTALADRIDKSDRVSVVIFGDACVEEGVFHESANFASLNKLPVLFVCENNLYSVYTPLRDRQPARPLTDLAIAHGMKCIKADGNDVLAVQSATREAVAHARSGSGPVMLVFDTYRWREHCGPNFDNDIGYRSEQEFQDWKAMDPVERLKKKLLTEKLIKDEELTALTSGLQIEIDAAYDFARAAPLPVRADAALHVYAD
jgi:TPP-dependent pyruvate/acetoin dehydrogenase alpha subunit